MIRTHRLTLRPVLPKDFDAIWRASQSDIPRWMYWVAPTKKMELQKDLLNEAITPERIPLVIDLDSTLIGRIFLVWREKWEMGFWILHEHRAQGYATEAASALMHYAFREMGIEAIYAYCVPENIASKKVIRGLDMRYLRTIPGGFTKNGETYDCEEYRIDQRDTPLHYPSR